MAATYINGNTFRVDFILWKKDIVSYFWHSYFFHPLQALKQSETKRFVHSIAYALMLTGALMIAAKLLNIDNLYFFMAYFPSVILLSSMSHYFSTLDASQTLVGRHYSFTLGKGYIRIVDNNSQEAVTIDNASILSISQANDMLIIYTKSEEFIIPTRVLNDSQISSILAFRYS